MQYLENLKLSIIFFLYIYNVVIPKFTWSIKNDLMILILILIYLYKMVQKKTEIGNWKPSYPRSRL